jgi:cytokinin riboside 5'-monophosphate phosphoribohydrolase
MHIAVYCSSSGGVAEVYKQAARDLGHLIAMRGHSLIYGGCDVGTMGIVARATQESGGRVLGVVPRAFLEAGLAYLQADELLVVDSMAERKACMLARSEACIALPGGLGTLDELADTLTSKQLGWNHGPIVLLNTAGFYVHLLAHLEQLYALSFARQEYRQLYHVAMAPDEALTYLETYREPDLPGKWF